MFALAACSASPRDPISNSQPTADRLPIEIKMTRTMCFGTCPAYTVVIHGDGRIDWQGEEYVSVKGVAHAMISGDQLAAISAELDKVAFFTLAEDGSPPSDACKHGHACVKVICTDTSHTRLDVTRGKQHHAIDDAHCTGLAVEAVEVLIDKLTNTERWIGKGH